MLNDKRKLVETPAEELREALEQLEMRIGKLSHSTQEEVLVIPMLFDQVYRLLGELKELGGNLQSEQVRFETLSSQLRSCRELFLRKLGGPGALQSARASLAPDVEQWWWFIDQSLVQEKQIQLRRWGQRALIVAAVLVVLVLLYNKFLAPDPALRAQIAHHQAAEQWVQLEDYPSALLEVEQALTYAPEDVELLVFKGTLHVVLEQTAEAEAAFAAARSHSESETMFLMTRAEAYLMFLRSDLALPDIEAVLAMEPESPYGNFLMGRIQQIARNFTEAQLYYEKASTLAGAVDEVELEAMARVYLAQMVMDMMAFVTPTPAPE
ncbi:MAG: hypothetical protein JXA33_27620 [Anaerolineae bacterium]|nr:hypothetical protein [Anaerolineae bacterium]